MGDRKLVTYLIQAASGPIKIGRTYDNPKTRLMNLQTGSAERLTLLAVLPGDKERNLHRRFAHLRIDKSEFFRNSAGLTKFVKSLNQGKPLPPMSSDITQATRAIKRALGLGRKKRSSVRKADTPQHIVENKGKR